MRSWFLLFTLLLSLAFTQSACDVIPEEGTIVYDVDYPRLNVGTAGSSSDGAGNTTTTNKLHEGSITQGPANTTLCSQPSFHTQTGKTIVRVNPDFYRPAEVDLLIGSFYMLMILQMLQFLFLKISLAKTKFFMIKRTILMEY